MSEQDELLGCWSAGAGYYDAMEDEELVLRPDGTGWIEWLRPGVSDFTLFRWHRLGPDRIRCEPSRSAWANQGDDGPELEEHEVPPPVEVRYRLVTEDRPLTGEVPVLRIELPFAVNDSAFALTSREVPEAQAPRLPWDY